MIGDSRTPSKVQQGEFLAGNSLENRKYQCEAQEGLCGAYRSHAGSLLEESFLVWRVILRSTDSTCWAFLWICSSYGMLDRVSSCNRGETGEEGREGQGGTLPPRRRGIHHSLGRGVVILLSLPLSGGRNANHDRLAIDLDVNHRSERLFFLLGVLFGVSTWLANAARRWD